MERGHLEGPSVDGRIIFRHIQEVVCGDMHWMELAQDRDIWQALVSTVPKLRGSF